MIVKLNALINEEKRRICKLKDYIQDLKSTVDFIDNAYIIIKKIDEKSDLLEQLMIEINKYNEYINSNQQYYFDVNIFEQSIANIDRKINNLHGWKYADEATRISLRNEREALEKDRENIQNHFQLYLNANGDIKRNDTLLKSNMYNHELKMKSIVIQYLHDKIFQIKNERSILKNKYRELVNESIQELLPISE
jgi:hypothetical protein